MATLSKLPEAVVKIQRWHTSVRVFDLRLDYMEGKDVEFWTGAVEDGIQRLDSIVHAFRANPKLIALLEVLEAIRSLEQAVSHLSERLADCHTCDEPSRRHAATLAAAPRDDIRALTTLFWEFQTHTAGILRRAETALEDCLKNHR